MSLGGRMRKASHFVGVQATASTSVSNQSSENEDEDRESHGSGDKIGDKTSSDISNEEEERVKQGEQLLGSYAKIWESFPEKCSNTSSLGASLQQRVSRSPDLLPTTASSLCNIQSV